MLVLSAKIRNDFGKKVKKLKKQAKPKIYQLEFKNYQ